MCQWSVIQGGTKRIGYIRIVSFEAEDPQWFASEVRAILQQLPQDRLIIDLRANPGGNILCGEALLQMLCREPIEPAPVSFRCTNATRRLANSIDYFKQWMPSLNLVYETGEVFSQGYPLSEPDFLRTIQSVYSGRVAIVVDGLSYSTTDVFAAGFADHKRGAIIGVDPMMGAGGANVWSHQVIAQFAVAAGLPGLTPLPKGASNVAVRRSLRVRSSRDLPVENLGARPGHLYKLTMRDILSKNEDLIEYAARLLE